MRRETVPELPDLPQRPAEDVLRQKQQRAQGLHLRGGRHLPLREVRQKRGDLRLPHVNGMPHPLMPDEPPYPADVGPLGSRAEATPPHHTPHVLQE
jgi:hypothetical protein